MCPLLHVSADGHIQRMTVPLPANLPHQGPLFLERHLRQMDRYLAYPQPDCLLPAHSPRLDPQLPFLHRNCRTVRLHGQPRLPAPIPRLPPLHAALLHSHWPRARRAPPLCVPRRRQRRQAARPPRILRDPQPRVLALVLRLGFLQGDQGRLPAPRRRLARGHTSVRRALWRVLRLRPPPPVVCVRGRRRSLAERGRVRRRRARLTRIPSRRC